MRSYLTPTNIMTALRMENRIKHGISISNSAAPLHNAKIRMAKNQRAVRARLEKEAELFKEFAPQRALMEGLV